MVASGAHEAFICSLCIIAAAVIIQTLLIGTITYERDTFCMKSAIYVL